MATNFPKGIFTSIFLRLLHAAPLIVKYLPLPGRREEGTSIFFLPDRYCPVIERGSFSKSSTLPFATTSPPWTPGPGPISTRKSAARIVSSSCSTTINVLPRLTMSFMVAISLSLSL